MIKAVFLDLDATLLRIDTDLFVRDFSVGMIGVTLAHYPALVNAPISVAKGSQQAVRAVLENLDPAFSNGEIYIRKISETLGLSAQQFQVIIDEFQGKPFGLLGKNTSPSQGASALIDQLAALGLTAVIATNPLFNLDAVMQRLAWAGLDKPRVPYAFI